MSRLRSQRRSIPSRDGAGAGAAERRDSLPSSGNNKIRDYETGDRGWAGGDYDEGSGSTAITTFKDIYIQGDQGVSILFYQRLSCPKDSLILCQAYFCLFSLLSPCFVVLLVFALIISTVRDTSWI